MKVRLVSGDLLFGSKVEGMIREAGFDVVGAGDDSVVLGIADLTDGSVDAREAFVEVGGEKESVPTLAYYAHTDDDVRKAALDAGFSLVVPRSRMMREGPALIQKLAADT
jgi:hypothetical protein